MAEETGWARRRVDGPRVCGLSPTMPCRLPLPAQRPHPFARTSGAPTQGGPEFQGIVDCTDECPFPAHLAHPT